jgi:hypothetical protein
MTENNVASNIRPFYRDCQRLGFDPSARHPARTGKLSIMNAHFDTLSECH